MMVFREWISFSIFCFVCWAFFRFPRSRFFLAPSGDIKTKWYLVIKPFAGGAQNLILKILCTELYVCGGGSVFFYLHLLGYNTSPTFVLHHQVNAISAGWEGVQDNFQKNKLNFFQNFKKNTPPPPPSFLSVSLKYFKKQKRLGGGVFTAMPP